MDTNRQEYARVLFATAMSLLEQAAGRALSGQGRRANPAAVKRAARELQTNAEAAALIAAAICRILGSRHPD